MIRFVIALMLACLLGFPALGFESAPVTTKRTVATLITSADSVTPGGKVRIALRLRLVEGWHTYWHNPGEAGVATEVTPALSPGATAGPIEWPAPGRISEGTITTYGYSDEVILPIEVTLAPRVATVSGDVTAHWLACKDICVPEEASFPLNLAAGTGGAVAAGTVIRGA